MCARARLLKEKGEEEGEEDGLAWFLSLYVARCFCVGSGGGVATTAVAAATFVAVELIDHLLSPASFEEVNV